jgi:GT2 family glycosyltransferase
MLAAITVAQNTNGLAVTLRSLQAQTDTRWQWCVVTGGDQQLFQEVFEWAAADPRVLVADGSSIPVAERLSAALSMADAEFLCVLGTGDTLDAGLVAVVRQAESGSWLYTDEATPFAEGNGQQVWFKPEFNPELVRSQPYPVRSAVLPLTVVRQVGGLSPRAGTAQWYDLVLRVLERIGPPQHLTGPYYIRAAAQHVLPPPWIDGIAVDRCRAVGEHCDRQDIELTEIAPIEVAGRPIGQRLVRRRTTATRVSIVIPTRGSSSTIYGFPRCHVVELIESMWTESRYPNLELVVVYDQDTPAAVLDRLRAITDGEIVLLPFIGSFHYSRKCNQGASAATGDYLCFLNDDMRVVTPDWLHELVSLLADPTVGAVGAKLLFADGTLQHAGHIYNGGSAGHLLFGHRSDTLEMGGIAQLTGERSGVTGACLLMRAGEFRELGGFSLMFPLNYNDVDLCLKIREGGLRILYTPHAVLDHYESQTRVARIDPAETERLQRRWRVAMHKDPMLNPLERLPVVPRPDALEF